MRREAKLLLGKACDALVLSIELFNRPHDRGRVAATLIQLDHGFEMLLKAAILHRGGRIREKRAKETIGFDACVRRSLSDGSLKYLSEEQALVVQTINGLRDAAQHHLLDISEGQLYVHVQSGVTLFRDLLRSVFDQELACHLPERVLPVSTSPPTDLATLFDTEVAEIKKLLRPGRRRRTEAMARLRPLAILDATIQGEKGQPSDADLNRLGKEVDKVGNRMANHESRQLSRQNGVIPRSGICSRLGAGSPMTAYPCSFDGSFRLIPAYSQPIIGSCRRHTRGPA